MLLLLCGSGVHPPPHTRIFPLLIVLPFLAQANDSTDHPGDWHSNTYVASNVTTNSLQHSLSHILDNLEPATEYHGALKVRNKYNWSGDTEFQFNTIKGKDNQGMVELYLVVVYD